MALSEDLMPKCSEHLSAYKSACEDNPDLQAFDAELQQRTNKVIDSLTVEDSTGKLSQHAVHMEVTKNLLEVTQGVANFITERKTDVWKNETLRSLVNAYFENTIETLKIFNNIAKCVENAEMGQLLIQEAVAEFDIELAENDVGGKKKKYGNIKRKLKAFKEMGDPFDGQVLTAQYELLKELQISLLKEVTVAKEKIQEQITGVEKDLKIVHWVMGTATIGLILAGIGLIVTGVGAGVGIGLVIGGMLTAAGWAVAYGVLGNKLNDLNKQLEDLKKLEELKPSVEVGININEEATKTVTMLVKGLEDRIVFMLNLVDNASEIEENEKGLGLVLNLLREKVEILTEKIKKVGESVEKHSALIAEARRKVQEKIVHG